MKERTNVIKVAPKEGVRDTLFRSDRCYVVVVVVFSFSRYFNGKKLQRKIPASLTNMLSSFTFHNRLP